VTPAFNWSHTASFLLPLLVFAIVIRRAFRQRKVKTERLWRFPAIFAAIAVYTMLHEPLPGTVALAGFVVCAGLGAGLGILRARHQTFTLDPVTGELFSKATPIGTLLVGGFFALRFGLEFYTHARDLPHALGLQRSTDAGLIFALSLMIGQRWEIWQRAKLLREARDSGKEQP